MATIVLYADKVNQMTGLIAGVKQSVIDYKAELTALRVKAMSINNRVCNMDDVIASINTSTEIQNRKIETLDNLKKDVEEFTTEVIRIDNDVADVVNRNKKDFYKKFAHLAPDTELFQRDGWLTWGRRNRIQSVSEWCKKLLKTMIGESKLFAALTANMTSSFALPGLILALLTALLAFLTSYHYPDSETTNEQPTAPPSTIPPTPTPTPKPPTPTPDALDIYMYDWTSNDQNPAISGRVTPEFLFKVAEVSDRLGVNPDDLMAIMAFESWLNPAAQNAGHVGLIQFGSAAASDLGTTTNALLSMNAIEQMEYVEAYYNMRGSVASLSDMYMAVLWPPAIGKPDEFVLWEDGGNYAREFSANAGLDINGDGAITKAEATQKVIERRDTFDKK